MPGVPEPDDGAGVGRPGAAADGGGAVYVGGGGTVGGGAGAWWAAAAIMSMAWSLVSFTDPPQRVQVEKYLVPRGITGMKKSENHVERRPMTWAAGVRQSPHRANTVPNRRAIRLMPKMRNTETKPSFGDRDGGGRPDARRRLL
jgi:hypothetical protein